MSATARREQILNLTHAIVDTEGFPAATPQRIAEAAGITRTVLYKQFGDLAGLFVALIDREAERAAVQFDEAISASHASLEDEPLVSAFIAMLRAVDAHPATWRLFLAPPEGAPAELHQRLAVSQDLVRCLLAQELRRVAPNFPDLEITVRLLHGAGRELLQLRLSDPETATTKRLTAAVRNLNAFIVSENAGQH
ncbi:TetR family transcriptional regulator [Rhodococcus wratislaviensis IFP 2016]|nr:TetR family transcriptional regulator [Rhodococcus wratislaviensis IFP 2016]